VRKTRSRETVAGVLLLWVSLWAVANLQAAEALPPFSDGSAVAGVTGEEQRIWSEAQEVADAIAKSDQIYPDPALTAYVQGIVDRLFPEFKGYMKVALLKGPQFNAFVLPDGHIYVNVGLLARFEDEAQLATVLAHEGVHFTHRHGYRERKSLKSATAFSLVVDMIGIPLVGPVIALSSIFGYSRELETEADNVGFQRLAAAGYDARQAPRTFEHLLEQVKTEDVKEPFFFATHPKLQDRVDNMRRLSSSNAGGTDGAVRDPYAARVREARVRNIENALSMGRAKSVIAMLADPEYFRELPPQSYYYLGEAYRLRGEKGDAELAGQAYVSALSTAPEFAPSYRALGLASLKAGRKVEAREYLSRYLQLAPAAPDRKYVESYLNMLKNQGEPP
jgi:predicted Zn-dependent protease